MKYEKDVSSSSENWANLPFCRFDCCPSKEREQGEIATAVFAYVHEYIDILFSLNKCKEEW